MEQSNINSAEFLLDVFERFGKDAQEAMNFVRNNQPVLRVSSEINVEDFKDDGGQIIYLDKNTDMKFDTYEELKVLLGNGLDEFKDVACKVNTMYLRKKDELSEDEAELLENYSAGLLTILDVKRRITGEKRVSRFQRTPFEAIDLGLPSGKKWANMNVGANAPEEPGMYFNFDEAKALVFEEGWEEPTEDDFVELDNNCEHGFTEQNGIKGMLFTSKVNGNKVFFPCSGHGGGTSWYYRGSGGYYWSGSLYSATLGRRLYFYSGGVYPQGYGNRFHGFAVRAVQTSFQTT